MWNKSYPFPFTFTCVVQFCFSDTLVHGSNQLVRIIQSTNTNTTLQVINYLAVAAPVIPVVISVGINPDHYITEDKVINDTENTIIAGL